jgi:hypothetical protein
MWVCWEMIMVCGAELGAEGRGPVVVVRRGT